MGIANSVPSLGWSAYCCALRDHTCALKNDDSVACWGRNHYGQLGDGMSDAVVMESLTSVLGFGVVK